MSSRLRSASIAGEWGLSKRAVNAIGTATVIHDLPVEVNVSKLLQLGESLRHSKGARIDRAQITARAPSLSIKTNEVEGLLQQLNGVGLMATSTGHITPQFKQIDLYGAVSEMWGAQATDFERYVVDKTVEASKSLIELDDSSRNDEMLMTLNEDLKVLHIIREKNAISAVSSRYAIRSGNGIFKTVTPPEGLGADLCKQCLKDVDSNVCLRREILQTIVDQRAGDIRKATYLLDWLQDLGLIIPHTVLMGKTPFFYSFPARVIDPNTLDSEKIAPNVRDIIAHFHYASEFSTVKSPGWVVGALAGGRRVGPAIDIPSKYVSLISRGLIKVEDSQMIAIDRESFQRAETLISGGENIDFSKMDVKLPDLPSGPMLYGEPQTKILQSAVLKGGLHSL